MRACLIVAGMVACAAPAFAANTNLEKECILKSAAQLPRVAGLAISKTEVFPDPTIPPDPNTRFIKIGFTAVGQSYDRVFICLWDIKKGYLAATPVR